MPITSLAIVDLPAPVPPTIPVVWPFGTARLTPSTATIALAPRAAEGCARRRRR